MARLPAVLSHLSRLDGRPLATLEAVVRSLRLSGHLGETKRGVGAAPVPPSDAASILLAMLTTDSPAAGPEGVNVYRTLTPRRVPAARKELGHLRQVIELPFGEALEEIIEHGKRIREDLAGATLSLTIKRPAPIVELRIVDTLIGQWMPNATKLQSGFYRAELSHGVDKITSVTVTEKTLLSLSSLIMGEIAGE